MNSLLSQPSLISFFAGIGGIDLGFTQAGFQVVAAYDIDPYAVQTYQHNVSPRTQRMDIRTMTWQDLPTAEVWSFGFPCQDLSQAGHQQGMRMSCLDCHHEFDYMDYLAHDRRCPVCQGQALQTATRSGLFFEVMRLLDACRTHAPEKVPKVLIAENVKQLRKYLDVLKEEYTFRGYAMHAQLFNSKY